MISPESKSFGFFKISEVEANLSDEERAVLGFGKPDGLFFMHPLVQALVARNAIRKTIIASEAQGGGLFRLFKRYTPDEKPRDDDLCLFNPRVVLADTDHPGMVKALTEINELLGKLTLAADYQGIIDTLDLMAREMGASAINERYETSVTSEFE